MIDDQRQAFPLGATVLLKRDLDLCLDEIAEAGTYGRVVAHNPDGSVVFSFGEWGRHIFFYDRLEDIQAIIERGG